MKVKAEELNFGVGCISPAANGQRGHHQAAWGIAGCHL
ncbi:hypothetical protein SLEP1_g47292 [Rubroshorea leprosula]|uniref:Uncharacterized protein n=1 Tax=Rubroshorea leprosula TaxID=152421 RepID=A0AAV5LRQ5_9ROSI|nr:hypothetical protein SLEP1_g47292 [Rubroshorea leprosula]